MKTWLNSSARIDSQIKDYNAKNFRFNSEYSQQLLKVFFCVQGKELHCKPTNSIILIFHILQ